MSGPRISMAIAMLFLVVGVYQERGQALFNFLEAVEYKALDNFFNFRGRIKPTRDDLVIVAVDEKSIEYWGRFPWSRDKQALLLRKLADMGVKAVAYDIAFTEPDETQLDVVRGLELALERTASEAGQSVALERLKRDVHEARLRADTDGAFTRAIRYAEGKGTNVVLGYFFYTTQREVEGMQATFTPKQEQQLEKSKLSTILGADFVPEEVPSTLSPRLPLTPFADESHSLASFNSLPDPDGVFRRAPMIFRFRDNYYPSLSLGLLSAYLDMGPMMEGGRSRVAEKYGRSEQINLQLGELEIPVDDGGRFVVNYYGPQRTFIHYSVADVMEGNMPVDALRGKAVLLGATAIAIYDLRNTPMDENFPGVEIHANAFTNILSRDFLQRPNEVRGLELLAYLVFGFLLGVVLSRVRLTTGVVVAFAAWLSLLAFAYYVMFLNGLWFKVVLPSLEIYSILIAISVYRYVTEEYEKGKIRKAFQQYMSPVVVDQVTKDPSKLKLGGEKREMTVLFSDIRGFTTISEKLKPEELVALLNDYLTPMTDLVFENAGTIDKYMGDAIMAFWGAPLTQPDHARRACRTALQMMRRLHELQKGWEEQGLPHLDIGIGLNSGPMAVGNMGSLQRFDYTVMGDNVNLGSRLEGINKEYRTNIIVSEFTEKLVREQMVCRELDAVRVKGKNEPVHIFELLGEVGEESSSLALKGRFEEGLAAYRAQQWDEAEEHFRGCFAIRPEDGPSIVYLERVAALREDPPGEGWDGVFVMKTK